MGRPKLLLPWGKGTLLEAVLENLLGAQILEVVVVLGPRASEIMPLVSEKDRVKVVLNPDFPSGMSSSIRRGLEVIEPRSLGIMIAMGDMPLIPPEVINRLIEAFRRGERGIVAPVFHGRRGHPVIFHRRYEGELRSLQGEEGGRRVIAAHPEDLLEIEVDCPGVIVDIDTPEDYSRFRP